MKKQKEPCPVKKTKKIHLKEENEIDLFSLIDNYFKRR